MVTVHLDMNKNCFFAEFSNLGVSGVPIEDAYPEKYDRLLCGGIWCIVQLEYEAEDENQPLITDENGNPLRSKQKKKKDYSPIIIRKLTPIQMPHIDIDELKAGRAAFTKEEWLDIMLRSTGMEPDGFTYREKWLLLTRMIPLVENNFNLCELGPRSTGKSHLYKKISPNSILVSGGQTTVANLFYNMGRKTVGLVGMWDCVAFDEVAGIRFKDKDGVQIMKDYMASGSFARGKEEKAASASMVFVGNINQSVDVLLKTSSLFDPFPPEMGTDTAFLDRIHCYLPGWEIPKFRPEHFTDDYGFISDYLAEFIRELRKEQYGDALDHYFHLGKNLNQRDTIAVRRMVDGYLKLMYPDGKFTKEELEEVLQISLEMRRRVKEQLKKLGGMEFYDVNFSYIDNDTLEEHYVSVPEQGGGKLIPEGICNPGQVYTVSRGKSGMLGVFRLESQMLNGTGKFERTGIGTDRENNSGDRSVVALAGVLSVLGVKFGVKKYNAFEEIITGTRSFLPLLRRMHGKNAEFRQLKFYKSPNFSNEVIEISQEAVISDIVNQSEKALSGDKTHRNFFITAPTGAGKSLLFQLPAIHLAEQYDAVTIVVSPLIALMKDQVEGLEERGVACATFLNSTISYEEREKRSAQIKNGEKSIVYLAPELLLSCPLETLLGNRKPGLFVVDEAHTVTSWGRDFRVDYWFLGDYIKKARRSGFIFPVLCLTATAVYGGTEDVVNETIETLGLKHTRILLGSVRRDNIDFDIRCFEKGATGSYEENKFKHSAKVIAEYVGESKKALIYCPYTTQVRELWDRVDSSCREKVGMYHGQLGTDLKNHYQEYFRNGKMSAMICTKAYGMGIDVKDITDCYHFAPSGNLADYIQEIGRIARDRNSHGTARIDFNPSDMRYTRVLHGISGLKQYQLKEMLRKLYDIYSVKNHRNMLVAPDVFGYLFDSDIENKVKNGLLLLSKDLEEKYGYPVIVVRPKTMFTKSFVCVAPDFEQKFVAKYSSAVRKLRDDASETAMRKNAGNLYEVNMSYIWENEFSDLTFADFKRRFFEGELFSESGKKQFWPRMKLSIRYKKPFEQVFSTLSDFIGKMSEVLTQLQDNGFFGFDEFHKGMKEKHEGTETELNGEFLRIILDTFLVEPGERFVNAKKNPFKFIQKRAGGVESKYRIINNNHLGLASRFLRLLSERKPNSGDDYIAYIPTADGSEKDKLMRLLNMLEILGLSSYEIRGGANVEVFVRINDPMKLKYLSTGKYTNLILRDIESKNNSATATLSSFFQADLTSEQRWNVVENYFLGNESAVKEALGVG